MNMELFNTTICYITTKKFFAKVGSQSSFGCDITEVILAGSCVLLVGMLWFPSLSVESVEVRLQQ